MRIWLVRHAESTFNAYRDKAKNVPLTPLGEEQAAKLSGNFDLVICSPLRRTRHTLEKSQITYGELVICPEVREVVYVEGDLLDEEDELYDESEETTAKRCEALYDLLNKRYKDGMKILVVSHGVYLSTFTHLYGNKLPFFKNAQMMVFTVDPPVK